MPIRAVLFDLDNTLLMEDAATFAALRRASERAGGDADAVAAAAASAAERLFRSSSVFGYADEMGIWWGEALWGDFAGEADGLRALRAFVPGFRQAVWEAALTTVNLDGGWAAEYSAAFERARRLDWAVDPAAIRTLEELQARYRLALVTNGAPAVQREKLRATGIGQRFATVVVSGELGIGKPDRRIFDAAVEAIGVAARDAVMVGDSVERDIEGARGAGLRTIWIDREGDGRAGSADARIHALDELNAALESIEHLAATARST